CTSVHKNIIFQGLFRIKSAKSCPGDDFCVGGGLIRSRVVKNVIANNTKQTTDQTVMVICHPCCFARFVRLSSPECSLAYASANFATNGSVKPPTMNCAIFTDTKRYEFKLARSLTSPVITPPNAE